MCAPGGQLVGCSGGQLSGCAVHQVVNVQVKLRKNLASRIPAAMPLQKLDLDLWPALLLKLCKGEKPTKTLPYIWENGKNFLYGRDRKYH